MPMNVVFMFVAVVTVTTPVASFLATFAVTE